MDARTYLDRHGRAVAEETAEKAGTNYAYFNQIAYGHRRPSPELAEKLAAASAELFQRKQDQLDTMSLLFPKDRAA
jgi:transcriptional regulator with XRE-family HTH domain